jgi:hypothetical protein
MASHRATAGGWTRGVLEQYVAGLACPEPVEGTPEDARKDGHIIRARSARLSPPSGFPVSRSQQADS